MKGLKDNVKYPLEDSGSALFMKQSLPNLEDSRNITISCAIGAITYNNCLWDIWASVNVMSHDVFYKSNLQKINLPRMDI